MDELHRLLEVVGRELGADDVRVEIGGRDPSAPHVIWARLGRGWRIVALFDHAPADAGDKREKLEALVAPFDEVVADVDPPRSGALAAAKQRELDEELDALAERAGARAALVFDERSPVLWGCSAPRSSGWDLDAMDRARHLAGDLARVELDAAAWLAGEAPSPDALRAAGVDETTAMRWSHRVQRIADLAAEWTRAEWREALQIATAVAAARARCRGGKAPERLAEHADDWGVFGRGFAQIYLLALVYDGAYSELHAEGPVVRALPHIETLVLSLPPVEPPPRGAKVLAFRR